MSLDQEIKVARRTIVTDGYEMSMGELINLYKNEELKIDPVFQRLFRWDESRKTRFIESILLGIPIPPIFVFQDESGIWELVDGLQSVSTLLQFSGNLKNGTGEAIQSLVLSGTKLLPSLEGKRWIASSKKANDGIGSSLQIDIKRARLRVEILKKESDSQAKFELFQRLNTGGVSLTEQEVRNSIAVMINKEFFDWLVSCSKFEEFVKTTAQTPDAIEAQAGVELVLRFLAFRNIPYSKGLDVHEYLDDALYKLAQPGSLNLASETKVFQNTFRELDLALGESAFKRWDGSTFKGKFLISVFEVMATGVSSNIKAIMKMTQAKRKSHLISRAKDLWNDPVFTSNSGAGVRGTTRLSNLLPLAKQFLKP